MTDPTQWSSGQTWGSNRAVDPPRLATQQGGWREWLLFACRSRYLDEVAEIVWRSGAHVAAVVDNMPEAGALTCDYAPVIDVADLPGWLPGRFVAVPLSVPGHRFTVAAQLRALGVTSLPPLVDPTAIVARTARVGAGCVVNAGAVIGARTTLGAMAHVNRSASVGHHNAIGDYASLGPGCVLAGSVTVRPGAFIGAGAVLAPRVTIGANATIGAGAVVVADVPDFAVVVGNPGRVLRIAESGHGGATVALA